MASRKCLNCVVDVSLACRLRGVPASTAAPLVVAGTSAFATSATGKPGSIPSEPKAARAAPPTSSTPAPAGTAPLNPAAAAATPAPPQPEGSSGGGGGLLFLGLSAAAGGGAYWLYNERPEQFSQYQQTLSGALQKAGIDISRLQGKGPSKETPVEDSGWKPEPTQLDTQPSDQGTVVVDAAVLLEQEAGSQQDAAGEPSAVPVAVIEVETAADEQPAAPAAAAEEPIQLDAAALDQLLTDALSFQPPPAGAPAANSSSKADVANSAAVAAAADAILEAADAAGVAASDAEPAAASAAAAAPAAGEALEAPTEPAVAAPSPLPPAPKIPAPLPKDVHPTGHMGVTVDLTPSGLLRYALDHGYGPGEEWAAYSAQHRQATADAAALAVALKQLEAHAHQQIAEVQRETAAVQSKADEMRNVSAEVVGQLQELLKKQGEHHGLVLQQAVKHAKMEATVAAVELTAKERLERLKAVDELRLKSNALEAALDKRSKEVEAAVGASRLAVALSGMQGALHQGRPFPKEVAAAGAAAGGDELVAAVVQAVPKEVATKGVPTREQLSAKLRHMQQPLTELSHLPEGSSSMLALLAAKVASKLKVSEKTVVAVQGYDPSTGTPVGALAAAEMLLDEGKLKEAADTLEAGLQGTAAASAATHWIAAARQRAAVEVGMRLMQAHTAAVAATMS